MEFKVSSSTSRCSSPLSFHHLTAHRPIPLHHRSHSASTPTTISSITLSPSLSQLPPHQPHHNHHHFNHHHFHKTMTSALEKCTTSLSEIHRLLRGESFLKCFLWKCLVVMVLCL
ncbi:hypothetical protein CRE_10242 [Caenorhabditis remanei]|uniref:Uncharacterized protein n=1 Tax=Caenorhabditis remanei TaxID=31234 RepID=E3M626_CAERE|nr:hypothetical protein CRE_10242 [Caenorhabditis remanei]